MKRGDVWWVDFDPSIGGEIQKTRPAVIVSIDLANVVLNRIQVIPMSSKITRVYRAEVEITLNGEPRKAMVDQITTVSKDRVKSRLGALTAVDMRKIEQTILIQLGLAKPEIRRTAPPEN